MGIHFFKCEGIALYFSKLGIKFIIKVKVKIYKCNFSYIFSGSFVTHPASNRKMTKSTVEASCVFCGVEWPTSIRPLIKCTGLT